MSEVDEREYALTWYYCELKVEEELEDYQCKDADGFPNCTTCEYQIKINSERDRVAEECRLWNEKHGTKPMIVRREES